MRSLILSAVSLFSFLPSIAVADDTAEVDSRLILSARESVAWLTIYKDGSAGRATGFVIRRPSDGRKLILTAGHLFQNGMTLSAKLPGMSTSVPCEFVAMSPSHDLMAVAPVAAVEVPALPLLGEDEADPKIDDPVAVIGCPGGLDWTHYRGRVNASMMTADELTERIAAPDFNGRKTPSGNALIIRHSTFSTPGMSGGPILDARGRVVGVQLGTLPKASNASLGIHIKHVANLNLNATPRRFAGGPILDSDIGHVLKVDPRSNRSPSLRIDGRVIDVGCTHQGYIPKNEFEAILGRYIQDQGRFRQVFAEDRAAPLLRRGRIAYLTNSAFGFGMLVPEGYTYRVETTEKPAGIRVTLVSGDETIAAPYNTITLQAYLNTDQLIRAREILQRNEAQGKLDFPKNLEDTPFMRMHWKRGLINGIQLGTAMSEFEIGRLGIAVEYQGRILGLEGQPVFVEKSAASRSDDGTSWIRANLDAKEGSQAHAVHAAVRENVMVIIHYQFRKQDRDDFFAGKNAGGNFLDRAFIASSVSIY